MQLCVSARLVYDRWGSLILLHNAEHCTSSSYMVQTELYEPCKCISLELLSCICNLQQIHNYTHMIIMQHIHIHTRYMYHFNYVST